jgi:PAS domain S-box-containing protein
VGVLLAAFLAALVCILFTQGFGDIAGVWLPDGIVAAILLRQPTRRWPAMAAAGAVGVALANIVAGEPALLSMAFGIANMLGMVACAGLMARWVGGRVDLTEPRQIPAFLAVGGILAPGLSGLAGALVFNVYNGAPISVAALQWYTADALGMLLTTPALLALSDGGLQRLAEQARSGRMTLPALTLVASLAVVFGQSEYPLSFLLLPPLIYCALRLDAAAVALALLVMATVSVAATVNGLGPMANVAQGLTARLELSQALLASMTLVALPLSAIQAHRRRLDDFRYAALEASELAEHRLRLASQIAGLGYWRVTTGDREVLWSDETFALHGLPVDGVRNATERAFALYSPEDQQRFRDGVNAMFETGETHEMKVEVVRPDNGQHRILRFKGEAQRNEAGRVVALFGVVRDITDEETFLQQIEASEARYRLLADSSTDVVMKVDPAFVLQYVSPSVRRYGYGPAELVGTNALKLVHPDDLPYVVAVTQELFAAGETGPNHGKPFRVRTADGAYVWAEGTPSPVRDEAGQITGFITPLRDVSERMAAQLELERSEARYRLITENATDVITCYGGQGTITYISPAVIDVFGYTPQEMIGRRISDFVHPDDYDTCVRMFDTYLGEPRSATPFRFEYRAFKKDGTLIWLEAHPRAVYDPKTSAFVEFHDVVRDITARKAMQDVLADSEARYRLIAEHLTDVVSRASITGDVVYISPSVTPVLGYKVDDIMGRNMIEHVHPDDAPAIRQAYADLITGRVAEGFGLTYRMRHADGHWLWLESRPTAVRNAEGRVTGFVDLTRDVTARVALEAELRDARDAAQAAAAVKAEFMANMSHEIRTPLTAILGFTSLLSARDDVSGDVRYQVGRIAGAGQALLAIVNDILDFSKLEAGLMPIMPKAVSPYETMSDALALFEPQAAAKGIEIALDFADDVPSYLSLDPDRVRQVLLNLVGNAVKFTEKGRVLVSARYDAANERLRVAVRDTGPGMEPAQLEKLFQRFSQVDASSSRRHGGTGLGLAICSGLADAMGGTITVSSAVGEGSEFVLDLPAAPCAAPEADAGELPVLDLEGLRVLVVDDNPLNRELARAILEPFGAVVGEACDGYEAVEMAQREPFDVILMDVRMPGMDGPDATLRIRSQPGPNRQTAILAFSADYDLERFGEQGGVGFNGFVRKPLELGALLEAISAVLCHEAPEAA